MHKSSPQFRISAAFRAEGVLGYDPLAYMWK